MKRLFFIVSIFTIFNISAFAKNDFEFILNAPLGASYSIISQNMKDYGIKNSFGFDVGVNAQFGGMFQIKEGFGISVLGDIGYSHDDYKIKYYYKNLEYYYFRYDGIQIGLLTKINVRGFSIGIGGGINFPIFGYWNYTYKYDYSTVPYYSYSVANNESIPDGEMFGWTDATMSADDIEAKREPYYVIPYAKLTFDYYIFFTQKWAVNVGLYCRYDFLPKNEIHYSDGVEKPKNYGTLNFGVQLGLRFGPRV